MTNKIRILIVLLSFGAFNANALEGTEVDVSKLNQAQSSAMSIDEIVAQIKKDTAIAKRFIAQVHESTKQMTLSHDASKRLVALCNQRSAKGIIGKAARDAYELACNARYQKLKARSEEASIIIDQMRQHLPIAGSVLKDGADSIELLKSLKTADKQLVILERIIVESEGVYKSLQIKE